MATYTDIKDLIDANLASGTKIPATKHREVEMALLDYIQENLFQSGDIKLVKCDLTYLNDNFEVDGLGKNLRLGWAICNGNNGTYNFAGKVPVGFGLGYSSLGGLGGNKDAVVVEHTHSGVTNTNLDTGTGDGVARNRARANTFGIGTSIGINLNTTGVAGTDKNMQPYIITLYIMKL